MTEIARPSAPDGPGAPPPDASGRYHFHALQSADADDIELAEECALSVVYNGLSQAVMMVTPADLEDFVTGFALSSGVVTDASDIYDIQLAGQGSAREARVEIANRAFWALKQQRRHLAGTSGCGLCGVEALEQALPELPSLRPSAPPPPAQLDGLRERNAAFQPLGRHCGAVHAAVFMDARGELRLGREDIGRHNALDKLIGTLAKEGRLDTPGFVVLSSRGSHELVRKCAKVGIAALATISAPTAMGVQMAELIGLRFWGLCRPPKAVLYAPGRT